MEYHTITQDSEDTLYIAEDSGMPIIKVGGGRLATLKFQAKYLMFDRQSLFQLADFIRHVAEDMENSYEQDAPF
ncbi:MAG: hypothetical protein VW521_11350 [Rhodospirillales bacterium]